MSRPLWANSTTGRRVVQVASAFFAERGYGGTTTRDIADEIGVTKAALYYHVNSKEDILYEICSASLVSVTDAVSASMVDFVGSPRELLARMVDTHLNTTLAAQDMHLTLLTEIRSLSPEGARTIRQMRYDHERLFREVIEQGQAAGDFRDDLSSERLVRVLMDLVDHTVFWHEAGGKPTPSEIARIISTSFVEGAAGVGVRNAKLALETP